MMNDPALDRLGIKLAEAVGARPSRESPPQTAWDIVGVLQCYPCCWRVHTKEHAGLTQTNVHGAVQVAK